METAKLFISGDGQTVRLPPSCRLEGSEVFVQKIGDVVCLTPIDTGWEAFFQGLAGMGEDVAEAIIAARAQAQETAREELFE
jgi:virulence-associated protein VagC